METRGQTWFLVSRRFHPPVSPPPCVCKAEFRKTFRSHNPGPGRVRIVSASGSVAPDELYPLLLRRLRTMVAILLAFVFFCCVILLRVSLLK